MYSGQVSNYLVMVLRYAVFPQFPVFAPVCRISLELVMFCCIISQFLFLASAYTSTLEFENVPSVFTFCVTLLKEWSPMKCYRVLDLNGKLFQTLFIIAICTGKLIDDNFKCAVHFYNYTMVKLLLPISYHSPGAQCRFGTGLQVDGDSK